MARRNPYPILVAEKQKSARSLFKEHVPWHRRVYVYLETVESNVPPSQKELEPKDVYLYRTQSCVPCPRNLDHAEGETATSGR